MYYETKRVELVGGPLADQSRQVAVFEGMAWDGRFYRYVVRCGDVLVEHRYRYDGVLGKFVYQDCGPISSGTLDPFFVISLTGETVAEARARMYSGPNTHGKYSPRLEAMAAFRRMVRDGATEKDAAEFVYGVLYSPMRHPWKSPEQRARWHETGSISDKSKPGKLTSGSQRNPKADHAASPDPSVVVREAMSGAVRSLQ